MLTSEEKEMLNALRQEMDDEQREAFDEMSDAEKKALLEEAQNQWNNMSEGERREAMKGGHASWENTKGQFRRLQDMSLGEFMHEFGATKSGPLGALFWWLILKMTRTKAGCGCLIVLVVLAVILLAAMVNT